MRSSGRSSGSSGYHADSERSSAYSEGDAYSLSSSNCGRSAPTLQPPRMADARNYIGRDSSTDSREYGSGKKRGTGGSASSDYEPFKPWTPGMEKHYGEYKDNAKAGGEYHTEYHSKQVSTNDRDRDPSFHQESSSKASQWGQAKQQESTGRRLMNDAVPSAYSSKTSRQTHQDEAESSLRSAQNARDRVGYHRNRKKTILPTRYRHCLERPANRSDTVSQRRTSITCRTRPVDTSRLRRARVLPAATCLVDLVACLGVPLIKG